MLTIAIGSLASLSVPALADVGYEGQATELIAEAGNTVNTVLPVKAIEYTAPLFAVDIDNEATELANLASPVIGSIDQIVEVTGIGAGGMSGCENARTLLPDKLVFN